MDKTTPVAARLDPSQISSSHVKRLEREVKDLKGSYDTLKIKTLCMSDEEKRDNSFKQFSEKLEKLKR